VYRNAKGNSYYVIINTREVLMPTEGLQVCFKFTSVVYSKERYEIVATVEKIINCSWP
jgi:hypothetical protein